MKTNNAVANYIADRKICKHMSNSAANAIWKDLRADGWIRDGLKLIKPQENEQCFVFEPQHGKVMVSCRPMEVTA